ncbi:DHA3 family multidrug efflux protein-like MFS transporter [Kibdelosporangium banguiense]|uniref:DHA3 family multidrug efflux protein-like MFS transporter n=1 Tax=Kibdelosporangium banguiense TaxID=1365924 RepID=A0ABS4TND1_9PSEU|nr:MFS transporter [Kibdelosporangium banguiense]MBP2325915.1 DHA3 family multidrug efflux protein-like MFS transporter [Kibdelosporangium banguiense]
MTEPAVARKRLDLHDPATRTFLRLLGNTLFVSVTNYTVWFAITFYVYLETRSVFATGLIAGLFLVLTSMTGIWFGSLVDHHDKKTMMLLSGIGSLVLYAASFVVYTLAPDGTFKDPASPFLWVFVTLLMLGVIVGNIRTIALPTLVTALIAEDLRDKANGLVGTTSGTSVLVTSVISGVLVAQGGMTYVLILALAVLLLATVDLSVTRVPAAAGGTAAGEPKRVDVRGTIRIINGIPGLMALILFSTFNNFLGGVFMALMDPYGLSLVSVEVWGFLWGVLSAGMILGGLVVARTGLGRNPVRTLLLANLVLWGITSVFTIQASLALMIGGLFVYLCLMPAAEAAEQTILQKVVPYERQGRVFGFAQSVELAAAPLTAFLISPIAQFVFIPFMTTGAGVDLIGGWFGTGPDRGLALVFTLTGLIGMAVTLLALRSKQYRNLSKGYLITETQPSEQPSA